LYKIGRKGGHFFLIENVKRKMTNDSEPQSAYEVSMMFDVWLAQAVSYFLYYDYNTISL
jgi:hypothetical protein